MNRPAFTIKTRYRHWGGDSPGSSIYVAGRGYAPCGVVITTPVMDDAELQQSVDTLQNVTCPACQRWLAAIGRAYAKARRQHKIDW